MLFDSTLQNTSYKVLFPLSLVCLPRGLALDNGRNIFGKGYGFLETMVAGLPKNGLRSGVVSPPEPLPLKWPHRKA